MSDLPPNWERVTLKDLGIEAQPGFASGAHNRDGHGVQHLRPMNISRVGTLDLTDARFVDDTSGRRVSTGDVLFNNTNSAELIGKTTLITTGVPLAFSNHMTRLRVPQGVLPAFLARQLHAMWTSGYFKSICSNHVNQASVSSRRLLEVEINLPPAAEQRRIVEALDDHLSRLNAAESNVRNGALRLTQARASALQTEIDGAGGTETPLTDLAWDAGYGTSTKCSYEGTGTAVARIPNVAAGRIELSDLKYAVDDLDLSGYQIKTNDLLIVRTNGSRDLIGRCAAAEEDLPAAFASYIIRFRIDPARANPQWVSAVLGSRSLRRRIETMAASSAGQYNLNIKNLGALPIPVPSHEVQASALARLEESERAFNRLSQQLTKTQQHAAALRRALLEAAFSGQMVPQDPNDEPASVLLERIAAERTVRPQAKKRKPIKASA